jgi:hypothetical protein
MRYDLFQQFLADNYSPEKLKRLFALLAKTSDLIYRDDYYAVVQLK